MLLMSVIYTDIGPSFEEPSYNEAYTSLASAHAEAAACVAKLASSLKQFTSPPVLGKRRHELEDDIENLRAQKCCLQDDVLGLRLRYQSTTAKIHTLEEECDEMEKKKEALENDPKVYGAQFFLKPSQTP